VHKTQKVDIWKEYQFLKKSDSKENVGVCLMKFTTSTFKPKRGASNTPSSPANLHLPYPKEQRRGCSYSRYHSDCLSIRTPASYVNAYISGNQRLLSDHAIRIATNVESDSSSSARALTEECANSLLGLWRHGLEQLIGIEVSCLNELLCSTHNTGRCLAL
jgi:hypothetical protein